MCSFHSDGVSVLTLSHVRAQLGLAENRQGHGRADLVPLETEPRMGTASDRQSHERPDPASSRMELGVGGANMVGSHERLSIGKGSYRASSGSGAGWRGWRKPVGKVGSFRHSCPIG
jgi:hypothetical protein